MSSTHTNNRRKEDQNLNEENNLSDENKNTRVDTSASATHYKLHVLHPNKDRLFVPTSQTDWIGTSDPYIFGYAAYYDDRKLKFNADLVFILGLCSAEMRARMTYKATKCRFVYENKIYETQPEMHFLGMAFLTTTGDVVTDYTLWCPLNTSGFIPKEVSVVLNNQTLVTLPVTQPPKPEKVGDLLVCTKDIYIPHDRNYENLEVNMFIEWVEMNRLLGVDHITVHIHSLTSNMHKILYFYYKTGYLDFVSMGPNRGDPFLLPRAFAAIDCVYRNMHSYRWVVNIDPDEMLVPRHFTNLKELLREKLKGKDSRLIHSLEFQPKVFYTDNSNVPIGLTFSANDKYVCNGNPKVIINTDTCFKMTAHKCINSVSGSMKANVTFDEGASYHYKNCETARVDNKPSDCATSMASAETDTRMAAFKTKLQENVNEVMKALEDWE